MNELSIFYFLPFIYILQVEVITVQVLAQQKKQRRRYEVCFQIRCSFYLVKLQYTNNFLLQIFSRFSVRYLRHLRLMIIKIFKMRHFIVTEFQFYLKNRRQKRRQTNHIALESYSELRQTFKNQLFAKIAKGFQSSTVFPKRSISSV